MVKSLALLTKPTLPLSVVFCSVPFPVCRITVANTAWGLFENKCMTLASAVNCVYDGQQQCISKGGMANYPTIASLQMACAALRLTLVLMMMLPVMDG